MTRTNRRVLLDTTPLLAFLNRRDQGNARAVPLFRQLSRERLEPMCPLPAALELHRLLVTRKPSEPARAHAKLEEILGKFELLMPTKEDVSQGRETLQRFNDQKISLTDATIAAMTRREGARVMTFDARHFRLMGAEVYGEDLV